MHKLLSGVPAAWRPGNVISAAMLSRAGLSFTDIRRLIRAGGLVRIRHGWYAGVDANVDVMRAVSAGGVLGCVSALEFHGAWQLPESRLHVYRSDWHRRSSDDGCPAPHTRRAMQLPVVPLDFALRQAMLCVESEQVLVMAESLITGRWAQRDEIHRILGPLGDLLDISDSGTETMVRLRLRAHRIKLTPQVDIPGVGPVDFLIGDRLVVEVDGYRYHANRAAFHRDRRRDQRLIAMGYVVVRLTWEQVMFEWHEVEQLILHLVRTKQHRSTKLSRAAKNTHPSR